MSDGVLYWLRHDLRLHDNPALLLAARRARGQGGWLLPVYLHDPAQLLDTRWGFVRMGRHRQAFLAQEMATKVVDHAIVGHWAGNHVPLNVGGAGPEKFAGLRVVAANRSMRPDHQFFSARRIANNQRRIPCLTNLAGTPDFAARPAVKCHK